MKGSGIVQKRGCRAGREHDWRGRWCAAALLTLCLFLPACGNQEPAIKSVSEVHVTSDLAPEQVLNRHLEGDPRTLDPSLATDVVGQMVLDDLFEGLVTLSADGRTVPAVATSWETGADGKTWTFHLRDDARWSNGQPVTADDFVYAWRRQVDPEPGSEYAQALTPIENAMDVAAGKMAPSRLGVESAGPRTLVVHLHAPTPYLLTLLTNAWLGPLYEPAVKEWGDGWTQAGHMVSDGAFQLSERVINGHIALVRILLLGRRPSSFDEGDLSSGVGLQQRHRSVFGGRTRLHGQGHPVQERVVAANPGGPGCVCAVFCDGDVWLQSRETSLRGKSQVAPGPQRRCRPGHTGDLRPTRHRCPRV